MSSSSVPELSYFCPRCGDNFRFSSVPELRAHLVSRHTYETLLVLSQVTSHLNSVPVDVCVLADSNFRLVSG